MTLSLFPPYQIAIEEIEEEVAPLVPAQVDEEISEEAQEEIRERGQAIMDRIRSGGSKQGAKAQAKRNWGKRQHKSGGRGKNQVVR